MSEGVRQEEMFPIFSIASNDFEKDLVVVKALFAGLEQIAKTEHGFKLGDRATLAAGWWFYDVYCTRDFAVKLFEIILPSGIGTSRATMRISDALQGQVYKYGSSAMIKVHRKAPLSDLWSGLIVA